MAKFGLDGVKDRQQRPLQPFVLGKDILNPLDGLNGIEHLMASEYSPSLCAV
jgi:hypothetical protein